MSYTPRNYLPDIALSGFYPYTQSHTIMLRSDEDERNTRNQEDHHRMDRQEDSSQTHQDRHDVLLQEL